jgi:hypothetical protein
MYPFCPEKDKIDLNNFLKAQKYSYKFEKRKNGEDPLRGSPFFNNEPHSIVPWCCAIIV